ncbi:MAG: T9SS type A sorting domain-containing protein [Saprospiraceae bacterium]
MPFVCLTPWNLHLEGYPFTFDFRYTYLVSSLNSRETIVGPGPHSYTFPDTGSYDILLILEESGCKDTVAQKQIYVESNPPEPVLTCNPGLTTMEVSWDTIPGAIRYEVGYDPGLVHYYYGGTSFQFMNLEPDSAYNFLVRPFSTIGCGTSESTITCRTLPCGPGPISFDELTICNLDEVITLDTIYGCNWSGNGIQSDGCTLNPSDLNIGLNTVFLEIEQDPCVFNIPQNIQVLESPELEADITSSVFFGETGSIDLQITNPDGSESIQWENGSTSSLQNDLIPGEYCVTVAKGNGCETEECFFVKPAEYTVPSFLFVCANKPEPIEVKPSTGIDLQWFPSTGLSCADCAAPMVRVSTSSIYTLIGETDDGRRDTTSVIVIVLPDFICGFFKTKMNQEEVELMTGLELESLSEGDILKKLDAYFEKEKEILVFPNPNNGSFQILSNEPMKEIQLINSLGQIVASDQVGSSNYYADFKDLPQGNYFLKIQLDDTSISKKILLNTN